MLAANLRLLTAELARAVPLAADRERCRALLANVEFVQFMAAPRGSSFRSPLFRLMAWLIVSALPVGVFLAVQISFLRYQSEAITTLHQVCLALDLAALSWFHTRLWLAGRRRRAIPAAAFWGRMALNAGPAAAGPRLRRRLRRRAERREDDGRARDLSLTRESNVSETYERRGAAAAGMGRAEESRITAARSRRLSVARLRLPLPAARSPDAAGEHAAGRRAGPPAHRKERRSGQGPGARRGPVPARPHAPLRRLH